MSDVLNCPHCGKEWDQSEYILECIDNKMNLSCDCGGDFSIKAKVLSVKWEVKKLEAKEKPEIFPGTLDTLDSLTIKKGGQGVIDEKHKCPFPSSNEGSVKAKW